MVSAQVGLGGWDFAPLWRVLLLALGGIVVAVGVAVIRRAVIRRKKN